MRAYLPDYDLRDAARLDEALMLLASEPGAWRPFAGGTDLMVLLESGALPRGRYLNIRALQDLRGIVASSGEVSLGALTTYTEIRQDALLAREFPLLGRAAREIGGLAIQNRGTIGGNIANASPAADMPPVLLVYDAALELQSVRGLRRVPYAAFHRGYKLMDLASDELIVRVVLPRGRTDWREEFRKVGTRRAQAISKVCFAGAMKLDDGVITDIRIAYGSVAPVPLRCSRTESTLRGRRRDEERIGLARAALQQEISPIDDLRSSAAYRRHVSTGLLGRFLAG